MGNHQHDGKCKCLHHKMSGAIALLIGATFLLGNLEVLSQQVVGLVWPSLIAVYGLHKIFESKCKCCKGCNCSCC